MSIKPIGCSCYKESAIGKQSVDSCAHWPWKQTKIYLSNLAKKLLQTIYKKNKKSWGYAQDTKATKWNEP